MHKCVTYDTLKAVGKPYLSSLPSFGEHSIVRSSQSSSRRTVALRRCSHRRCQSPYLIQVRRLYQTKKELKRKKEYPEPSVLHFQRSLEKKKHRPSLHFSLLFISWSMDYRIATSWFYYDCCVGTTLLYWCHDFEE